jgi:hypothetical protein
MTEVISTHTEYGIKETREALALGLGVLKAVSAYTQKKNAEGTAALMQTIPLLFPAIDNVAATGNELRDLHPEEIDFLVADVNEALPAIAPEKALKIVRICLVIASSIGKGVIELKA